MLAFRLDTSGSMAGAKLEQAKKKPQILRRKSQ